MVAVLDVWRKVAQDALRADVSRWLCGWAVVVAGAVWRARITLRHSFGI
jgi:hypothetical protein